MAGMICDSYVGKLTDCNADINDLTDTRECPDWRRFSRIDRMWKPGLTEAELLGLIVKCVVCGLIMTRQVFEFHSCDDDIEMTDYEDDDD